VPKITVITKAYGGAYDVASKHIRADVNVSYRPQRSP
jgi:acetyl-CoA carboxylase carboxyltransferase component